MEKPDINQEINLAHEKISKIITKWCFDEPVFLEIFCRMDKKHDPNYDTLGIDTRSDIIVLRFNPKFVNKITNERLEGILFSEGYKVLLRHPTTRMQSPKTIAALASQITVDQNIANKVKGFGDLNDIIPLPENFNINETLWFEEYFRKLMDNLPETEDKIEQMFGGGQGEGEEDSNQNQNGEGDTESNQNQNSEGDTEEEGNNEKNSSDNYKDHKNEKDAMKDYFDPRSNSNQNWGENSNLDQDVQDLVNSLKSGSKQWGTVSGEMQDEIYAANKPKIHWSEVLKHFNTSVYTTKVIKSRMKLHRRHGLEQPGNKRTRKSSILFATDISGSISDESLSEATAVVNGVCRFSKLYFCTFDTEIKDVITDYRQARKNIKITGRGGTDFECVMELSKKLNVDGIVIFTDGYADTPSKPNKPVLWLMVSKEQSPPVEWGFKAHLNTYDR